MKDHEVPRTKLTARKREVLSVIDKLTQLTGRPPTIRGVSEKMGFRSTNAVLSHLRSLRRRGLVEHVPRAFGITLTAAGIREARGEAPPLPEADPLPALADALALAAKRVLGGRHTPELNEVERGLRAAIAAYEKARKR